MNPTLAAETNARRGWGTLQSCATWPAAEPGLAVQPVLEWLPAPRVLPVSARWALPREQEQLLV